MQNLRARLGNVSQDQPSLKLVLFSVSFLLQKILLELFHLHRYSSNSHPPFPTTVSLVLSTALPCSSVKCFGMISFTTSACAFLRCLLPPAALLAIRWLLLSLPCQGRASVAK